MIMFIFPGQLASCGVDKKVIIWNTSPYILNKQEISPKSIARKTLVGHKASVYTLCELSNGVLASGSVDRTIKLWEIVNGRLIQSINAHDDAVMDLALLDNGDIVSASADKTIKIWGV